MGVFISENLSTIIVGAIVLGIIAFALVRTILNLRKGRFPCGCGCEKCGASRKKNLRAHA
ncbi:FeoB-associated Cys-rich membrane protein [Treponema sp. TIM-1]|uniref:FeoB-associated Cys-rich membrane protein n=1 Tax=Treponema sp. TIM-1 TaxID=2898417 RepID=UPI00397EED61